jgi:4,5-DOPA dioxygenase extradiol
MNRKEASMAKNQEGFPESGPRLPVLFVGHGSPMNIIEDNDFSLAWEAAGQALHRPKAIVSVSAHWQTKGTRVTAMETPRTIYDFYGFPKELYSRRYPAPGSPALAQLVQETVKRTTVELDCDRGLDHGTWSVLSRMFPKADIPVVQLSLDATQPPAFHYELGRALKPLRDRGKSADLSVPTNEHYLPMLYALGLEQSGETPAFFAEGLTLGSISMRSFRLG